EPAALEYVCAPVRHGARLQLPEGVNGRSGRARFAWSIKRALVHPTTGRGHAVVSSAAHRWRTRPRGSGLLLADARRHRDMRAHGILLALALLATPLVARGQPAAGVLRIAYLSPGARDAHAEQLQQAFRQGLNELGWTEGRN